MHELFTTSSIAAFFTLTILEVVLGIDNIVFIAILTNRLPEHRRPAARRIGLALAALGRIILLLLITWVITLDKSVLFSVLDNDITAKDLILIAGGIFLVAKATWEIHHTLEGPQHDENGSTKPPAASFAGAVAQIIALDLVFSIDSVLTAIGMVNPATYTAAHFPGTTIPWTPLAIMVTAILAAIAAMLIYAGPIARFIEKHPTFKVLALSFLLLVGIVLVAEGLDQHIQRGYIYSAMAFSFFVELLNLRLLRKRHKSPH